jgi:hypothetical protein
VDFGGDMPIRCSDHTGDFGKALPVVCFRMGAVHAGPGEIAVKCSSLEIKLNDTTPCGRRGSLTGGDMHLGIALPPKGISA